MGAVSQVMADGTIHRKPVQTVRIKNHPPYGANKFKRLLCGDPVKDTIFRMKAFPEAKDVQEECCIRLAHLAEGGENAVAVCWCFSARYTVIPVLLRIL
jgi:hypothetical protein